MSTMKMLFRTTAVVVGSSAALLVGGIAHADTGQPVNPGASASNAVGQLATSAANAPQMLQTLASALGATPQAPPPLASAEIRAPQPMPGMPGAAPAGGLPGITSVAPATTPAVPGMPALPGLTSTGVTPGVPGPATGPAQLLPSAKVDLPQIPFLGVPLPQQLSLPGDLASLALGRLPTSQPVTPPVAFAPTGMATPQNPLLLPLSALP